MIITVASLQSDLSEHANLLVFIWAISQSGVVFKQVEVKVGVREVKTAEERIHS